MKKELGTSWLWGGKGLGRLKMKHEKGVGCFMVPMTGLGGVGKAKNEASKRVCVFLMVRKSGVGRAWEGSNWFPTVLWEWFGKAKEEAWTGLGRLKMKHENGVGYFVVPKSGVGRVWEGSK